MIWRWFFALSAVPLLFATGTAPAKNVATRVDATDAVRPAQVLVMLRLPPLHLRGGATYSGSYGDAASQAARRRIANGIARKYGMRVAESWPMPLLGVDCLALDLPPGLSVDGAIALLSRDKAVLWAQPVQTYEGRGAPATSDPLYLAQPSASAWRLSTLHSYATGRGVRVAVIDSKIELTHPDLAGQFSVDADFVGGRVPLAERHGTGVAGVIAAKADNGIGVAGVAPAARLMALRACWESTSGTRPTLCSTLSLAKAIEYAIDHDAQIINLSLSGPPDPLLDKLIDVALTRGISVVAAYDGAALKGGFPASKPGVIAVTDESLPAWPATVYGAPGRDIPTTEPGGKWYIVNGSSYAAAHVAGLIALARERRSGARMRIALKPNGRIIDACATLVSTSPSCDCECAIRRAQQARGKS
ncbi:S8 family serine peptidase [Sphingomonas panacisoli]|uniref:S8 family serine peptidase n=1 Tax=Sphingomonas panacisoli TaxID=1813879 RepID=A0A5B8LKK6_9SPHN|nr:S8 family serine peptidase [Sphingomonas panacisoli]QDZ08767.1 S8 family serine peptidase [Sphingomonas panacisoli]